MWCEVELERNQMSWWLEEMAVSQLPAVERERERERERGGGGGGGSGHTHTHTDTHIHRHTWQAPLKHTYIHTLL